MGKIIINLRRCRNGKQWGNSVFWILGKGVGGDCQRNPRMDLVGEEGGKVRWKTKRKKKKSQWLGQEQAGKTLKRDYRY